MDFVGKICPYCRTTFTEDDEVVVCSVCEMPHHKDCWIENKACTTFGCTGTITGVDDGVKKTRQNNFCSNCGMALKSGQRFCTSCGAKVKT